MSAVSKKVMPASMAAWTTRTDSVSSMRMPKLLQPRPTSETSSVAIRRDCITVDWAGREGGGEEGRGAPPAPPNLVRLVGREAVQKSGAAGAHEVRLTAAAARVRRVPRPVGAALVFVGTPLSSPHT